MEINITKFFADAGMIDYSASAAEIGPDAGRTTWRQACEDSADFPLLTTDEQREAFRQHVKGFGAWSAEEIAAWTDAELNALCMQMVAGDIREVPDMDTESWNWNTYYALAQRGTVSSRLTRADDGQIYYYLGD